MIDISSKLDPSTVAALEAVHGAAHKQGVSFFVVGATARDLILRHAYRLPVRRATRDIDFAIRVADWREYQSLVDALVDTGDFERTNLGHRFLFKGKETIDIVPFGPIAGENHAVGWPPNQETVMGVLGFAEAFRAATLMTVQQVPRLDIPVSTLAGLAVMKLISWNQSYPARRRDAEDFYYVAEFYIDAGNDDRLYNEDSDLTKVEVFDRAIAGARLLGRDMDHLAEDQAHRKLAEILDSESDPLGSLRLITDIIGTNISMHEKFDEVLALIASVREGFSDRLSPSSGPS